MRAAKSQPSGLRELIEETLPIVQKRTNLLGEVKQALEEGDDRSAIALMRRYVGLPPAQAKP